MVMRVFKILLLLLLVSCGSQNNAPNQAQQDPVIPSNELSRYQPQGLVSWQLQGVINRDYRVELYDIDLFDSSTQLIKQLQSAGNKVICYFSAGSYEGWRADAALFNDSIKGEELDDWPGERWLDIRSPQVFDIMVARLELAQQKIVMASI